MADILERIVEVKRDEITALRKRYSLTALEELAAAADRPRGFAAALRAKEQAGKAAVIAEIKKASPSKGVIRADFDAPWIAAEYAGHGAACLSVLTDERFFQGHNDFLRAARAKVTLPVIRKDFLVDPLQVIEARGIAADCVLLIAACLSSAQLRELYGLAQALGMDVLVEIHNADELDLVLRADLAGAVLLGINNRNLRTFETRLETTLDLLPRLPKDYEVVTESGIATADDVRRMRDAGVHRFLIGESLMRQPSPGKALAALTG